MFRATKLRASLALAVAILAGAAVPAEATCFAWKEAAPVIAKNGLLPASAVYESVQQRTGGKIVQAKLCNDGGRFTYRFVVLGKTGEVTKLSVDAKTGQF
jgi:uncharacterized membrane protein YkoI